MKHIKNYNDFEKMNEVLYPFIVGPIGSMVGGAGAVLFLLMFAYLKTKMPFLSNNPFKNIKRWIQVSRVIKKYDKLLKELDDHFKDDPELIDHYNRIKKFGDNSPGYQNQTSPNFYIHGLKQYIIRNVPEEKKLEVERLFDDMDREVKEIVPSLFD